MALGDEDALCGIQCWSVVEGNIGCFSYEELWIPDTTCYHPWLICTPSKLSLLAGRECIWITFMKRGTGRCESINLLAKLTDRMISLCSSGERSFFVIKSLWKSSNGDQASVLGRAVKISISPLHSMMYTKAEFETPCPASRWAREFVADNPTCCHSLLHPSSIFVRPFLHINRYQHWKWAQRWKRYHVHDEKYGIPLRRCAVSKSHSQPYG